MKNFDFDFNIKIDTSQVSIEATLIKDSELGFKPVQKFSRKLNTAESFYPTHDRYLLTIVSPIKYFSPYVDFQIILVLTDHKLLKYVCTQPNINGWQVRWI